MYIEGEITKELKSRFINQWTKDQVNQRNFARDDNNDNRSFINSMELNMDFFTNIRFIAFQILYLICFRVAVDGELFTKWDRLSLKIRETQSLKSGVSSLVRHTMGARIHSLLNMNKNKHGQNNKEEEDIDGLLEDYIRLNIYNNNNIMITMESLYYKISGNMNNTADQQKEKSYRIHELVKIMTDTIDTSSNLIKICIINLSKEKYYSLQTKIYDSIFGVSFGEYLKDLHILNAFIYENLRLLKFKQKPKFIYNSGKNAKPIIVPLHDESYTIPINGIYQINNKAICINSNNKKDSNDIDISL